MTRNNKIKKEAATLPLLFKASCIAQAIKSGAVRI